MDGADSSEPDRTKMVIKELEHGLPYTFLGSCAFLHSFVKIQYHQRQ